MQIACILAFHAHRATVAVECQGCESAFAWVSLNVPGSGAFKHKIKDSFGGIICSMPHWVWI